MKVVDKRFEKSRDYLAVMIVRERKGIIYITYQGLSMCLI